VVQIKLDLLKAIWLYVKYRLSKALTCIRMCAMKSSETVGNPFRTTQDESRP